MPSVLIIDDEPNIRRMVSALLTSEGFEVRDAADGASGIARADEFEPDLVLLDLMIPGAMDGMAVLERLRARFPELPVIMMSGRAGLADAVKATRLGAVNFLEKPLTPEGVLLAIASALELRMARRERTALRADLGPRRRNGRRQPRDARTAHDDPARRTERRARDDHRARAARARSWSPRRSTRRVRAASGRSCG